MSTPLTVLGGAAIGMAAGSIIVPFTRRSLAASVARASAAEDPTATPVPAISVANAVEPPRITTRQWALLAVVSGAVPAYVMHKVGWSFNAIPPLLLVVGLIQLAYCDLMQRLLPKTLVHALTVVVIGSAVVIAGVTHEWHHLLVASIGGAALFLLFFVINLVNPRWLAFGDVRLSLVVGFGLTWVSWMALVEGLLFANLLAAVVGLCLIALHKAERHSAVPFGLYLAIGAALVLVLLS